MSDLTSGREQAGRVCYFQSCTGTAFSHEVRLECAIERLHCLHRILAAFSAMLDDNLTEKEAELVAQLKAAVAPLVLVGYASFPLLHLY